MNSFALACSDRANAHTVLARFYALKPEMRRSAAVATFANTGTSGIIEFGNSIYFVKAVGKNNLIKANKSNFNEFIYSISLK